MLVSTQQALPMGYKLNGYEIRKLLSAGGFSFVYIARDENKKTVAIKEYLPATLAFRAEMSQNVVPETESSTNFKHGLKCFFEEGRALANINHKNIVRVTNFFRANETVYMVMQYERGKSLQEHILSENTPISENFIRRVFCELCNGLREVHANKLLHLDIKPANIYIRLDGSPVLLDFGSARQTLNSMQPQLPPSYTPGFAPPEQYEHRDLLGPWSDVYSLGATMYSCISHTSPLAANERVKKDAIVPLEKLSKGLYSKNLLNIIENCMALDHMQRPQSVFAVQKALLNDKPTAEELEALNKPNLVNKVMDFLNKPIM